VQDELKKLVAPLKRDIAKLWQELYITPDSTDELDNFVVGRQPCTSIEKLRTFDVVCRLRHKKSDLEEERDRRRKALDKAMDHIHELWTMLKINEDDEDRRKFIARKDALPAYSAPQIAVVRSGHCDIDPSLCALTCFFLLANSAKRNKCGWRRLANPRSRR
jgi:hypothetical protein